jgi:uncharacterized protein YbaR (Trm112 family)
MNYSPEDYCACPECLGNLTSSDQLLACAACNRTYPIRGGIPILLPEYHDEERKEYFRSYQKLSLDELNEPLEHRRDIRHSVLLRFIGNVRGKRILDIGSSNALYLREIDAGFKVALDMVQEFLKGIPAGNGVAPICGDAEKLPVRPGFFDVIIISDILEHLLHPELLTDRLRQICRPDTRIVVHIPWEEDISIYRDSKYKFAHLRSFNAYQFAQLWPYFYIRKVRDTYPSLEDPFVFKFDGRIPRVFYNMLLYAYYHGGLGRIEYRWREKWINELPKREWWLLRIYKPKFRMYELRLIDESFKFRMMARCFRALREFAKQLTNRRLQPRATSD